MYINAMQYIGQVYQGENILWLDAGAMALKPIDEMYGLLIVNIFF